MHMYNSKRDNSKINNKVREQPKILIIEDDARLGKTLSDVLEVNGYTPIAVLTGKEGVAAVKEEDIFLALLDLKLPDISGIDVLKEIKKISPRTEAIILTAFATLETAMEAVNLGAFSYLQKPYDMERLLLDIRRALERRWARDELRTSAETYSDLCDRSAIAIVNVYKDYRVDCTDRLLEWTGWSREEMEHINFVKESRFINASGNEVVLPPLVAAEMIEKTEKDYIPKLMRGETLEGVYQCYNRKDGGTVPLELNSVGYFGGKEPKTENFVHTICIFTDITERKKAEETLRKSERKYRDLGELLPEVIFETDVEGNITYANQIAFDSFGYTQSDFDKGLSALQMLIPEDRDRGKENIQRVLSGETIGSREYTAQRKDKTTFPVIISSRPIIHENKPVGLRGVITDITERKRAEEEEKKSRKFLAAIIDNIPDTVTIRDTQHRFVLVNQAYCNIIGVAKDEVIGKTAYWEKDKAVFQTGKGMDIPERSYTDLEGTRRYVSVKKAPLTDESGEISHVVTISRDITVHKKEEEERERLLKELVTLDKMKTDFLTVAYHEMRTPLAPIMGYTSLLEQSELPEKQKRYVRIIDESAYQLDELINRLLEVTRMDTGRIELKLEPVSISEIVTDVLERIQLQVDAKKQTISTAVPEGIEVEGDKQGITAIFDNLISNAIKYTGEKGRIDIVVEDRKDEGDIRVCVADTGVGISEENLPRIFERFYMVDTSLTRKGGLGLGLTIVKGYVKLHGGEVWATSELVEGSKFWFTLPKKQR